MSIFVHLQKMSFLCINELIIMYNRKDEIWYFTTSGGRKRVWWNPARCVRGAWPPPAATVDGANFHEIDGWSVGPRARAISAQTSIVLLSEEIHKLQGGGGTAVARTSVGERNQGLGWKSNFTDILSQIEVWEGREVNILVEGSAPTLGCLTGERARRRR